MVYDVAEGARKIRGALNPAVLLLAEMDIGQMDEPEPNRNTPLGFSRRRSHWIRESWVKSVARWR
jgi:hypothetical protein